MKVKAETRPQTRGKNHRSKSSRESNGIWANPTLETNECEREYSSSKRCGQNMNPLLEYFVAESPAVAADLIKERVVRDDPCYLTATKVASYSSHTTYDG